MRISERQLKAIIKDVIAESYHEDMPAVMDYHDVDQHSMDQHEDHILPREDHMSPDMCDDACSIQDICDAELRDYCIACWCARNNCARQEFDDACSRGRR